jgi:hypothetical protein
VRTQRVLNHAPIACAYEKIEVAAERRGRANNDDAISRHRVDDRADVHSYP